MKRFLALCMAICCLMGAFGALGEIDLPEGDFILMINVGKGDAILLRAGGKFYLIDTAKSGKWERVEGALNDLGVSEIEAVFLTHTDKDHSGGLKSLVASDIRVNNWYASGFYTCDTSDHPMVKALKKQDATIYFLTAGDAVGEYFTVLAPAYLDEDNEDNNSLVMMFDNGACRVLLCGDMEGGEEIRLLLGEADLTCDIFKVPNHADDDVCKFMDLKELGAKIALISTDPYEKAGTPDVDLLSRLESAGMEVYRTDFSDKGILVTLDEEMSAKVY